MEVMKSDFELNNSDRRAHLLNEGFQPPLTGVVSWAVWLVTEAQRSTRCLVIAKEGLV